MPGMCSKHDFKVSGSKFTGDGDRKLGDLDR